MLDAISKLDIEQQDMLKNMETKLQKIFNSNGTWRQIVEEQMDFMPTVSENIRFFWEVYFEHEKQLGNSACPNEFVVSFVSQNFPGLAEPHPAMDWHPVRDWNWADQDPRQVSESCRQDCRAQA
ncbi:hypothetical protein Acidovoranil_14500 [Acidovorax sp. FG27]